MRLLIFDTETTGLNKTRVIAPDTLTQWPYIVQFSYIVYNLNTHIIEHMNDFIIKLPDHITIPIESIEIHKITNEISKNNGIQIEKVLSQFFNDLNLSDKIIGHNVEFDFNMVRVELMRLIYNLKYSNQERTVFKTNLYSLNNCSNKIECTMKDSVDLCNIQMINKSGNPYLKFPKLIELHEKLFITKPNGLHNSLNDIIITLRCYIKLKYNYDIIEYSHIINEMVQKLMLNN